MCVPKIGFRLEQKIQLQRISFFAKIYNVGRSLRSLNKTLNKTNGAGAKLNKTLNKTFDDLAKKGISEHFLPCSILNKI